MNLLKKIPIKYTGELHDIRLINFSVEADELKGQIPLPIKFRDFSGRAMFSMVDVKLKRMRPSFIPSLFHFNYRHIAFRLLVEDAPFNNGKNKGIYFYRSFTNKPLMVTGGKLFTDYNLEQAHINEKDEQVTLHQEQNHLKYSIGTEIISTNDKLKDLQKTVGALDRAYSMSGSNLRVTQIQREKWPIQPVECTEFKNTFFETAKLEGAFRVFEVIHYKWLPPKAINL